MSSFRLRFCSTLRGFVLGFLACLSAAGRSNAQCQWADGFGVPGADGSVQAFVAFDDGGGQVLYAAGQFTTIGGISANRIAKWDGASWSALGSGTDGTVQALTVFDDGGGPALYAGGIFTTAGGVSANSIAKWNGSSWSALGSGIGGFGSVNALTVFDDGGGLDLYAGGGFTTAGGVSANYIARWNGSTWSALGSGMNLAVRALVVFDDGGGPDLYAGGSFFTAGGGSANRIAKWNGSSWSALGSGVDSHVNALTVFDDGGGPALYAGGNFANAGGVSANRIAKWNGSSWSALGSGVNIDIYSLTVFDDGGGPALYAGGLFTMAGGMSANRIAKWNGSSWSALGSGTNDEVRALTVFDDGGGSALYAGGSFTSAGGNDSAHIAKWSCAPLIFVDASAFGANDGSSWVNAFTRLQDALAAAQPGNQIWVANGTYKPDQGSGITPGDRTATFQLKNGVTLYGGFVGGETSLDDRKPAVNTTTLSGDLLGNDIPVACSQNSPDCDDLGGLCVVGFCIIRSNNDENGYHVLNGSGTGVTAVLDGFIITGGNSNGIFADRTSAGGGMYTNAGNPTVRACIFTGNSAGESGGGMFNESSNPVVRDCTYSKNYGQSGGGMFNHVDSNPTVVNCAFRANAATLGAGMYNNQSGDSNVINCTFTGNAAFSAGAMANQQANPKVTNCTFIGNSADFDGGGLWNISSSPTLTNCTFSANGANNNGGGVFNQGASSALFRNCILWSNIDDADATSGGPFMDESAQIHNDGGNPGAFFSIVQGGWSGPGLSNLDADPLFVDPDGVDNTIGTIDDNLRLRAGSPAINSGNTLFVPADAGDLDGDGVTNEQTPLDLDSQPRFVGMVDQGAYEYFTDCNHNGVPDSTDIAMGTSQDCGSGGKYWPENGIPDECDIATCPQPGPCVGGPNHGAPCTVASDCPSGDCAGEEFLGCQDCNLNGAPDACDIFDGSSFDADENRIPDECGFFTGDCVVPTRERFWTCPENWLLGGLYPDDEDSAAGISVNLPDGAVVILDEYVAIPNLYIHNGAELQMITPDTGIDVDQSIQIDGTLTMESCKIAGNTPPILTIRAGGKFQTTPCTSEGEPSTMTAAEIRVIGSDCFIPPCLDGGQVDLDESIIFTSTGDLIIDGSMANGPCDTEPLRDGDGNRLSFHTPPSLNTRGSSTTTVQGTVYMYGAPHMNIESSVPVELAGDFENQSVRPDCFHWSSGALTMLGTQQEFEVAATDVGAVGIGGRAAGMGQAEFAMGAITIAEGSSVTFRDSFDNNLSGQEPCTEAAYIGALTLEAGASMTIQNCRVYYATLTVDPSATISMSGCAELLATPIAPPPQVALDPSGINKTRFVSFAVPASPGSGETALRVKLVSLHHVVPPYTGGPSVPFTSFEGQVRWVGPPVQYIESNASPTPFHASSLQCAPHYQDWSTVGLLHVTGSAIVPSSIYDVENVAASCMGIEASCTAVSAPLPISTTRWGDVETPYNPPSATIQPDLGDVGALVNKFRSAAGAPIKARALLAGEDAFGNINLVPDLNFGHIAACVDAFRGKPYPHTIAACP